MISLHISPGGLRSACLCGLLLTALPLHAAEAPPPANVPLRSALRAWVEDGGDLARTLQALESRDITTAGDASAVGNALRIALEKADPAADKGTDAADAITDLFARVATEKAWDTLVTAGIPQLRTWAARLVAMEQRPESTDQHLLRVLKVLAFYEDGSAPALVTRALGAGIAADSYFWTGVMKEFNADHPHAAALMATLARDLPDGFAGIAVLDAANTLGMAGKLETHPFDSAAGEARLRSWLENRDPGETSYAVSATVALAFLDGGRHTRLYTLATAHPDADVRLEAAWAAVKAQDSREGLAALITAARDPAQSSKACAYLEELGHKADIPDLDDDFKAKAAMIEWLCHPNELGAPPLTIEQMDTRKLYWPPTEDTRQVWLFRFTHPDSEGKPPKTSYGMTGSMTWSFFTTDPDTPAPTAESLYIRHCALELRNRPDKEKKGERGLDTAAARRLLTEKNPGQFTGETPPD